MLERAYSVLEIRAVDEGERVITGLASTPTPDRYGDVVEPMGAKFSLPMPLLWQHRASEPVGHVEFAKPAKDGIPFRARIAKIAEPGELQNLTDKAWQAIKAKLVRAVSIGFKPVEYSLMENGGLHFLEWEWLELSLVTIPANADATIQSIKAIDTELRAASGQPRSNGSYRSKSPGASGLPVQIKPPKRGSDMKSITETIASLEASRAAKEAAMLAINEKAATEGRTKDASEKEDFDTLAGEIERIDSELDDWRVQEKVAKRAKAVGEVRTSEDGTLVRQPGIVRVNQKVDPGIRFARVVKSLWHAHQQHRDVEHIARKLYPDDSLVHKAAVQAGSTTGASWGDQLVGDETTVFADFAEFLRPQTILGKFGTNGIPSLNTVPFRTPLLGQNGGGNGYWVNEGKAKALTAFGFTRTTLEPLKVANIAVATKELLRASSPAADRILRDSLANALRERLDTDFISQAKGDDPGVSPASITNAAPTYQSSGDDLDAVIVDVRSIFQGFIDADNPPTTGVWIMSSATALALALMINDLGQPAYGGITMNGGTFYGLPVITSEYVGSIVVLANAQDIYLGDEGGFRVDVSTEASLEMKDQSGSGAGAASGTSITPTAVSVVSMFQTNSVAFLCEREINWALRRASAVQVLEAVSWGGAVTAADS